MEDVTTQGSLTPQKILRALRNRKLYLVVPVLLATAVAAVTTRMLPVRYRAQSLIAAEPVLPADFLAARPEVAQVINVQEQLRTIRETLLSDAVVAPVAREHRLPAEMLKSQVQITVDSPGAFFIGFESRRGAREAMDVTNALAEGFTARTSDLRGNKVKQEESFLDAEVDRARAQWNALEESVKSYKQNAAQDLPERLTANLKQLDDVRTQIQSKTNAITENQGKRLAIIEEMQALEAKGALDPEPAEKTTADVALETARLRLAQLKTRYRANHPEVQRAQEEVREMEAMRSPAAARRAPSAAYLRHAALKAELASVDQLLKDYMQERTALSSDLVKYERRVNSAPGLETELASRLRDAALARGRYEALYARQQEAKLAQRAEKSTKGVAFRIVEPARLPQEPVGPVPQRLMLIAAAAGLCVGLATVIFAERMDSSFATVEEMQEFTNVPVLSAVPAIAGAGRPGYDRRRLPVVHDPNGIAAEQFKVLSLKIVRAIEQSGGQVLVVTSGAGGEGKSFTALNLALSLSLAVEGKVLLIDADMRRPQLHQYLGASSSKGLGDLLTAKAAPSSDYIIQAGDLSVMLGGIETTNPVGLLASPHFREVLARLKQEYRIIVLDSPPIVPIADSHILSGIADGVLMVVRARQTKRELLRRALESLGASNLLGIALNHIDYADTSYAYACHYYTHHYLRRR